MILKKESMGTTYDGSAYVFKQIKKIEEVDALKVTSSDVQKVCIPIDTYLTRIFEYCYNIQDYQEDAEDEALYLLEDGKGGYCQVTPQSIKTLLNMGFEEVEEVEEVEETSLDDSEIRTNFRNTLTSYEEVKEGLRKVDVLDEEVEELKQKVDYFKDFKLFEKAKSTEEKMNRLSAEADDLFNSLESILTEEVFEAVEELKTKYDVFNSKDLVDVASLEDMATLMEML